jgi:hypothetical protein
VETMLPHRSLPNTAVIAMDQAGLGEPERGLTNACS